MIRRPMTPSGTLASHPAAAAGPAADRLACLRALERTVLWRSTWMIRTGHCSRPRRPQGRRHQASRQLVATLMAALYFDVPAAGQVAVKPHASPVYHAIRTCRRQTRDGWRPSRLGGAQSIRAHQDSDVDSTGRVGLRKMTSFAALCGYAAWGGCWTQPPRRMVAVVGDASPTKQRREAMLEGWKHDLRSLWVIGYNRQSLDSIVSDRLFHRIDRLFHAMDWHVVTLKYGKRLEAAFTRPGGEALKRWIDDCPNSLYSALAFKGGAGWREHLRRDLGDTAGLAERWTPRRCRAARADDQPGRPGSRVGAGGDARGRRRRAGLLHRLHDQGVRPTLRRPQGQSRRADEP
jgi:pyruvate dehydrogenase E1 component